ncbi:MAG: nucleotide exchange factor GrpE [Nitrososphaerales archaeon]|nr:nucleotide exchange factor GrpE [Nitrososphaerales archaeon]
MGEPITKDESMMEVEKVDKPIELIKLENEIDELKKALKEEHNRAEEYLNRLKYLQADFENFQKRVNREIFDLVKYGNERLIVKLLSVIDDLERAIKSGKESDGKEALLNGIRIVLKELMDILKKEGLDQIDTIGKSFDPNLHEAIEYVETKDCPENTIVEEIRKGYLLNERLIRPSMVKVAIRKGEDNE